MNLVAQYLAKQILAGKASYEKAVEKYPEYKEEIDEYLRKHHYFD